MSPLGPINSARTEEFFDKAGWTSLIMMSWSCPIYSGGYYINEAHVGMHKALFAAEAIKQFVMPVRSTHTLSTYITLT